MTELLTHPLTLLLGALFFGFLGYLLGSSSAKREAALADTQSAVERATLAERLKNSQSRENELQQIQAQFAETFKALSHDALKSNNQSFLELAQTTLSKLHQASSNDLEKRQTAIDQLVKPVRESLEKFDSKIAELEKARVGAYEGLAQQVRSMTETQGTLREETSRLVRALSAPKVRGRWGEVQLKRVVELAGMLDHCDFSEQVSVNTEDGKLRPDLVVHLPAGKSMVIDAKAPLAGYLEAMEATDDETRKTKLQTHARQVRDHAVSLGRKSYWEQFAEAPEFVVLFLPGEAFFSAALEFDPELIDGAAQERVIIATPVTLIALLKAVAFGWRQERIAENASQISVLGKDLYKRLGDMTGHFTTLGKSLERAVESYNSTVGSLERKVLPGARKFKDLETTGILEEIRELDTIDTAAREIQSAELLQKLDPLAPNTEKIANNNG